MWIVDVGDVVNAGMCAVNSGRLTTEHARTHILTLAHSCCERQWHNREAMAGKVIPGKTGTGSSNVAAEAPVSVHPTSLSRKSVSKFNLTVGPSGARMACRARVHLGSSAVQVMVDQEGKPCAQGLKDQYIEEQLGPVFTFDYPNSEPAA